MAEIITPTVIIPVLNDPTGLARCIEAIQRSSSEFELIVVDNGSTDETLAIARRYTDGVLVCPGMTIGAMRNEGAKIAKGSVLVFIDSDQEPSQDWLSRGVQAILSDDRIGLAGARYHAPPESRWVARTWDLQRRFSDRAGDIEWLEAGNLFARREVFEAVGGFRTDLIASEDVDLSLRVRRAGYRVVCDPGIVNYHHGDPQTLAEFFHKERWRGSSGWRAWRTQGYPLEGLPSLLWPVWVLTGFPVLTGLGLLLNVWWLMCPVWLILVVGFLIWLAPAAIRAVRTCPKEFRSMHEVSKLMFLYFVYGLARLVSVTLGGMGPKRS